MSASGQKLTLQAPFVMSDVPFDGAGIGHLIEGESSVAELEPQRDFSVHHRSGGPPRAEQIDGRKEIQIDPDAGKKAQGDAALRMELVFADFANNPVIVEKKSAIRNDRIFRSVQRREDHKCGEQLCRKKGV
jgi:hypothetical protein